MATRAILATKILKFSRGSMPPDPPRWVRLWCTHTPSAYLSRITLRWSYVSFWPGAHKSSPRPGHKMNGIILVIDHLPQFTPLARNTRFPRMLVRKYFLKRIRGPLLETCPPSYDSLKEASVNSSSQFVDSCKFPWDSCFIYMKYLSWKEYWSY